MNFYLTHVWRSGNLYSINSLAWQPSNSFAEIFMAFKIDRCNISPGINKTINLEDGWRSFQTSERSKQIVCCSPVIRSAYFPGIIYGEAVLRIYGRAWLSVSRARFPLD